ncbi:MAG: hypothetical protein QOH86_123 [Sphingomonadales bacterium]|jgi:hypothetical protein|nr:hypothetical protein [Sphingomonadales bacterium]
MHSIGKKNKYLGFLFLKLTPEYFALGKEGILRVTTPHVKELSKYTSKLTHVITTGMHPSHDQITIMEADTLEEIYEATIDFKLGAKAAHIDIVDVVVGIKAPPRNQAEPSKLRE